MDSTTSTPTTTTQDAAATPREAAAMPQAQALVRALMDSGMSPEEIARALDNRVSWRSVYRWKKGDHRPQRPGDLVALYELAVARGAI
jgi:transposase-like protein